MAILSEANAIPSSTVAVRKRESSFDAPPAKRQKDLFLGYFRALKWPDLNVRFADFSINVHRFIMGRRSAWFDRACAYAGGQGVQSEIILLGDDVVALQAFFYFCYDLPYEDAAGDGKPTLMFYVKLYAIAAKYECEEIMEVVARKLNELAGTLCSDKEFGAALNAGYKLPATPKGTSLREAFEIAIGANLPTLVRHDQFRLLVTRVPDLAVNLLYQNVAATATPVTTTAVAQYQASRAQQKQQKNRGRTIDQNVRTRNLGPNSVKDAIVENIRLKCEGCHVLITDTLWKRNKRLEPRGERGETWIMACPVCAYTMDSSVSFLRTDEHITVLT